MSNTEYPASLPPTERRKPWGMAIWSAVISFPLPGIGQILAGARRRGIIFFILAMGVALLGRGITVLSPPTPVDFTVILADAAIIIALLIFIAIDSARLVLAGWSSRPRRPWFQSVWVYGAGLIFFIGLADLAVPSDWRDFAIPSGSNVPTLLVGDRITTKSPAMISAGDMIVFIPPGDPKEYFVKRVVGLPGDRVQLIDSDLYINGAEVARRPLGMYLDNSASGEVKTHEFEETLKNGKSYKIIQLTEAGFANNTQIFTVPPGALFVLGDSRDNSEDSRFLDGPVGFVPIANVIGKVYMIYWPLSRLGAIDRSGAGR